MPVEVVVLALDDGLHVDASEEDEEEEEEEAGGAKAEEQQSQVCA